MGYIFLFLSVFTNAVKGYCSKRISGDVKNAGNAVTLNLVRNIFVVAVSFAIGFFTVGTSIFELTLTEIIITGAAGVSMALFVIFWTLAVKTDAYMLVSASGSASFVVPAVIGCFLLGETLTYAKISSFALIVVALYFLLRYQIKLGGKISAKSLALLAGVLLSQGINQSMQKVYVFYIGKDASAFTAWSFVFTVIALIVGKLILPRSEYSEDKKLVRDNFLYILLMAAGLFGTSYFQTAAASRMDAIILYPLSSALSLVAGSTMASIFFKEKIKRDCVIGVIIVFLALILSRADTLFIRYYLIYTERKDIMYTMKDGILFRDDKPVFGLGISYYASFHPEKKTVPDDGDKFGEMVKDVADIAKAGFNHIRTAALGARHWDGDTYVAETSFPDVMTKEADKNGLAVFMRLNGYTMNQRGWEDAKPIDQFGNASAGGFIHDTLNHPELIKDTDNASAQLAIHFAEFPNIIGFQLFNEPTIQAWNNNPPSFFDYNPYAMAEFKKWLVRKGYYSEEGAYAVEVPKEYPIPADKKNIFRLFRQFGVENTSAMLCRLNGAVRKATPHLPCFTNCIAVPFTTYVSGCEGDCFEIGDMDIIGFDLYEEVRGFEYFHSMRLLDMCENAAFVNGKKAWLPEMCCRTHMRIDDYERECYAAIGAGYKGVTYYLWRADLGGPEVQLGGMLWNNRDKTEKFEDAVKFNEMINKEGESIVTSEVVRDGVAILYSVHGAAMGEGSDEDGQNRWYRLTNDRYVELVEMGVAPVFITADKLASAPFDIKLLFVPTLAPLDAKEKTLVEEFAKTHAVVAYDNRFIAACGDKVCGTNTVSNWCHKPAGTWQAELFNHRERFRTAELLEITGVKPLFKVSSTANTLALRTLKNDNAEKPFYLLSLVHTRADGNVTTDGVICFDEAETGKITVVRYVDRNGECVLEIERRDGRAFVKVPYSENIGGAFMYLYR